MVLSFQSFTSDVDSLCLHDQVMFTYVDSTPGTSTEQELEDVEIEKDEDGSGDDSGDEFFEAEEIFTCTVETDKILKGRLITLKLNPQDGNKE